MPELLCVHGIRQGLSLGSWTLVLPCGALKAECEALLYLGHQKEEGMALPTLL